MLEEFGPDLSIAGGPTVSFFGFPYPTRMAVARLRDGSAWVWSPIALTLDLEDALHAIGPVREIASPRRRPARETERLLLAARKRTRVAMQDRRFRPQEPRASVR